jgi:pimeloyl-ACP methyl ester carboxylesterase
MYYEARGEGEPLLLIHGLGSSTEDWEAQVEFFAKRFRVVSYDVRGHGKSSKPRSRYSVPQFAADAAALIEHLQLGPAHVLGISMGGMVALQLTVDRPDLVRSLTVVNSGPEMVLRTWRQKIAIYQRFAIVRMMGMRRMGQVLSKALLPLPEHASHRQRFVERWARNHPGAYLRSLRALIGWTVTQRLGTIACPTLILTADMDYTPVAFKQWYTAQIPGAELAVIAGARHMLPVERPNEFNEAVANFLWKLPARATTTPTLGLGTPTRSATA